MQSSSNTAISNRRVVQLLQVAGGVALVVLAVHSSKPSFWMSRDRNTLRSTWGPRNEKRGLQYVRYDMPGGQSRVQLPAQHYAWPPPIDDQKGQTEHFHDHKHSHGHHNGGHGRNTDDDDSKDENDDDNSKDENGDDDEDEDNNDSRESHSSSGISSSSGGGSLRNENASAAIQSSVVTNLDGVNIGNTITIINIGTGSGGQQSSSASADNNLNGSNPFAVNGADRSAITSAAVRAFCDAIDCSSAAGSKTTTTATGSGSVMFSLGGGNGSRDNEATYEMPEVNNGGSVASLERATWLLLISILTQL